MIHHVLRALAVALLLVGFGSRGGTLVMEDAWAEDAPADEDGSAPVPNLRLPTIAVDREMAATFDFRGKRLLLIEFASW